MANSITGVCADGVANFLGIFDLSIAPHLLYYSYIPILIISSLLGIFILLKDKKSLLNQLFFIITISFALWILNVLIQWIAIPNSLIYLSWKIMPIFEIPIYLGSVYFVYVFASKKDLPSLYKKILLIVYLGFVFFSFTKLNIADYDYVYCEGIPGFLLYVMFGVELLSIIIISFIASRYLKNQNTNHRDKKILKFVTFGIIIFLSIFWYSEVFGVVTKEYGINLIGPVGAFVFVGLITYAIVQYKAFNIKMLAAQALVFSLIILISSQFFFIEITTNFILNGITLIMVVLVGLNLIYSIKKEVEQKEKLERLKIKLEEANDKLKKIDELKTEFLSLASHQLRSPLTVAQGYLSMILEGDYGEINDEAKEVIERVFLSSKNLSKVVEDLLNVTKIEQGGMKYEMVSFDLSSLTREIVNYFSINAERKNLKILFKNKEGSNFYVNGDKEKIRQVILNLIDNSIKYTKEGGIDIFVDKKDDKILISIKDTGVGLSKEVKQSLFKKFARGEGGKIDSSGTGLGLYLAKEIIEAHKGRVWVESPGLNMGSTFYIELNAQS